MTIDIDFVFPSKAIHTYSPIAKHCNEHMPSRFTPRNPILNLKPPTWRNFRPPLVQNVDSGRYHTRLIYEAISHTDQILTFQTILTLPRPCIKVFRNVEQFINRYFPWKYGKADINHLLYGLSTKNDHRYWLRFSIQSNTHLITYCKGLGLGLGLGLGFLSGKKNRRKGVFFPW